MNKQTARLRRAKRTRMKIRDAAQVRLCVHRTPKHTYAQIIGADAAVVAAASTVEAVVKAELKFGGNVTAATRIGELVAERALAKGVKAVAFDRSGFSYHGRVAALAEAARKAGLKF